MTKLLTAVTLLIVFSAASSYAWNWPGKSKTHTPKQTITGTIVEEERGDKKIVYIQTDKGSYEVANQVTAAILGLYEGKTVKVTGRVKMEEGRRQIVVRRFSFLPTERSTSPAPQTPMNLPY